MLVAHHVFLKACVCSLTFLSLWARLACATDNYAYRVGEYAIISGGQSPDGCLSIAAHGDGDYGYDGFELYLMGEPTHEKLASLRIGEHLDTAPLSNIALWAPDSRHIAILYRTDRRVLDMRLFGIVDGKVQSIEVPSLVKIIGQRRFRAGVPRELFTRYYQVSWQAADSFTMEEFDTFDAVKPVFRAGIDAYVEVDRRNVQHTFTNFSASAVCEITKDGKLHLSETKPLSDRERTIVYSPHLLVEPQWGLHDTETTMSSLEEQKGQH